MKALPVLTFLALTLTAPAQEWTRFRGPDGSGISPGNAVFPAEFSDAQLTWKIDLPGSGVSSPVLWGNRLFLTVAGEDGTRSLIAFDSLTGEQRWSVEDHFTPHDQHQFNSFASSTPVVDAERVYIAWTSGGALRAMALTHEGKKVWERDLGPYKEEHGSGSSPVLAGGRLIISKDNAGEDSALLGLNPEDGSDVWRVARQSDRTPFATPLVTEEPAGNPVVVFPGNPDALTCIQATDGKVLWKVEISAPGMRPVASAATTGGILYASVGQGGGGKDSVAVKVSEGKPEIIWQGGRAMPYVPTPLGTGGCFYMLNDGGILSCVRAATGEQIWSERVFADKAYSSPILSGGRIYCIGRSGVFAAVAAGETYMKIGECRLGEACDATPAIVGNRMYIRTATHLLCLPSSNPGTP